MNWLKVKWDKDNKQFHDLSTNRKVKLNKHIKKCTLIQSSGIDSKQKNKIFQLRRNCFFTMDSARGGI